ncbi:dipeptide epimerase [Ammoniphilus sp. CFH 90114]|uniref:dipeptide epimerase n=1 Tax=Ammoniphilus sp. CFH 90114 TaxID=2493665 RepID=UPI00100DB36E|nr:dipeptide epimerase [Ammoniphilus sp. CFH 90114]RXT05671.1 dipeptide epimerase [Ammoniphilus sp. CFH 90114]
MKVSKIELIKQSTPLKKPFKTALRTAYAADEMIVRITADTGEVGYGAAPPTAVITGDTIHSIAGNIEEFIAPRLMNQDLDEIENLLHTVSSVLVNNNSAKAAVDMALYDLWAKKNKAPLYKLLGGSRSKLETDITISVNAPEEMADDAHDAVQQGISMLKIKVGNDAKLDLDRVTAVRERVGKDVLIRLDANQGWTRKEAVRIIRQMEDMDLQIELVEQPVKAHDLEGLKFVTDQVETPILADESMFSARDALKILEMRAADLVNIKLMKCGGIYQALKINAIAESYGVECMLGCMLESSIGITAAAHLAAAKKNITRVDLDSALLLAENRVIGGVQYKGSEITLGVGFGLGIEGIQLSTEYV